MALRDLIRRNNNDMERPATPGDWLDRFFEDAWGGWPTPAYETSFGLRVDVRETDDSVVVTADLPGVDEKEIDVTIDEDRLILSGERKHENEEKRDGYHRIERGYGHFRRTIQLPAEVVSEKAEASYKRGVLNVTVPKAERAKEKRRRIPIK